MEQTKHQSEPVLCGALHYMKFIKRHRAEEQWADAILPREIEQEVLDILDRPLPRSTERSRV